MFFDDESDDERGGGDSVEAVCQKLFVELMKLKPSTARTLGHDYWKDSIAAGDPSGRGGDRIAGSLYRRVAIVTFSCDDVNLCGDVVRTIHSKLKIGKFKDCVHCHAESLSTPKLEGSFDVLIVVGGSGLDTQYAREVLVTGGLLSVVALGRGTSPAEALDEEEWAVLGSLAPPGSALRIDSWQRLLCRRNPLGAMSIIGSYTGPKTTTPEEERANIALCCVPLSSEERKLRVLSDQSQLKLIKALREQGLVILPGFFDAAGVLALGAAFSADMARAAQLLMLQGVDILTGTGDSGSSDRIENYHELAMREARRCDVRDSPTATALFTSGGGVTAEVLACPDLKDALQQVMNPAGGADARGNWGRWNFEGDGPDARPPDIVQRSLGCVMSLPGCADQTIHTDTPHLQVNSHLPPHYLNLFLPATQQGAGLRVGQTAFVLGSHTLKGCADVMVREGGDELLLRRLVRPHLKAGDGLLFDTRILHFGLANQSGTAEGGGDSDRESEEACWRPVLYANITQAWFSDPKNWDNRKRLFA